VTTFVKTIFNRTRCSPVGLQIADSALHAVQYSRSNGHVQVRTASQRISEDDLHTDLRKLLDQHDFTGREIIAAMPSRDVDVRPLRLPIESKDMDSEAFLGALTRNARSVLLYDPAEAVLDYLPLGEEENGQKDLNLLLVATRKEHVNRLLAHFDKAHVKCRALDVSAQAGLRAVCQGPEACALIELDHLSTNFSVGRNGSLLFSRLIKFGMKKILDEVADALGLSLPESENSLARFGLDQNVGVYKIEEAATSGVLDRSLLSSVLHEAALPALKRIADEVGRSLQYFRRLNQDLNVPQALLTGPLIPEGVLEYLQNRLGCPVSLADPFSNMLDISNKGPMRHGEHACIYTVAAGLAIKEKCEWMNTQ